MYWIDLFIISSGLRHDSYIRRQLEYCAALFILIFSGKYTITENGTQESPRLPRRVSLIIMNNSKFKKC